MCVYVRARVTSSHFSTGGGSLTDHVAMLSLFIAVIPYILLTFSIMPFTRGWSPPTHTYLITLLFSHSPPLSYSAPPPLFLLKQPLLHCSVHMRGSVNPGLLLLLLLCGGWSEQGTSECTRNVAAEKCERMLRYIKDSCSIYLVVPTGPPGKVGEK